MASPWIALYTRLRDELLAERGPGGPGANAKPGDPWTLPRTRPFDCLAILGELQPEVVRAIKKHNDVMVAWAAPPKNMPAVTLGIGHATPSVDVYLLGLPAAQEPLIRLVGGTTGQWWRAVTGTGYGEKNQDEALSYILSKWDACMKLAAGGFAAMPLTGSYLSATTTTEWWRALYALCIAIEVVVSTPSPGLWDRIKSGVKYAADETVKELADAGQELVKATADAAAEVTNWTAETLGQALHKFVANLGLAGWIFVAAGIYLVSQGWV